MSGGKTEPLGWLAGGQKSEHDARSVPHVLVPGTLVGEWLVLAERGHGGFGTVYRAKHVATGALAAIKVLHPELAKHDSVLARFDREVTAVRALRHPNIVKTIGDGELHDGRPYLVMEWLDGRDLLEIVLAQGALAPDAVLRILAQVASALDAVHAAGIIHRDIKPTNLIATGDHVVLVDFGIAKLLEPSPALRTETGVRLGSPEAMAPEQITGGAIDARTDVYALGVLLYFLLTARVPFAGDAYGEVERMHISAPRPRPSAYAPVSPAVDEVVVRAMSLVPADRQPSAGALFDELARAIIGAPAVTSDVPAIGVRIDVEVDGELDDAMAVAIDDALLDVRDRMRANGLAIAIDTTNLLLATANTADSVTRARIDRITTELSRTRVDRVTFRVRVRVGAGAADGRSGSLLDLDAW